MKFKLMPKSRRAAALAALTATDESGSDKIYNVPSSDFAGYASFFEKNHLEELIIEEKGTRILFRKWQALSAPAAHPVSMAAPAPVAESAPSSAAAPAEDTAAPVAAPENVLKICSPLNGTFYATSAPENPPYVALNAQVSVGTILCMVEAMKIFNEIKAESAGRVVKILAKNAEAVKEGQELFWIEP